MTHSEQIGDLIAALSKAQGEMTYAKKDSSNPFFKSTYSDLASIWDAIREPLTHNALAVTQTLEHTEDGMIAVDTLLAHASGQWVRGRMAVRPGKDDVQAAGSCCTYLRRYSLAAICGIAPSDSDDDGEAAMARDAKPTQRTKPAPKPSDPSVQAGVMIKTIEACDSMKSLVQTLDSLPNIFGDTIPDAVKEAGRTHCEAIAMLTAAKGKELEKLGAFVAATRYMQQEAKDRVLAEIESHKI